VNILSGVPLVKGGSQFLQAQRQGRKRAVRTRHLVSALQKEPGDGGESAASNADEMNVCHRLDEYHKHKDECQHDRKIDGRFAQQTRRQTFNQIQRRAAQFVGTVGRFDIRERVVCLMQVKP